MNQSLDAAGQLTVEEDLAKLLRLNYDLCEVLAGKKVKDESLVHSEGLAKKLFSHTATALHLKRNHTRLADPAFEIDVNFVDWASIQVLARASAEVVLAFNYVYRDPQSRDDAEFRYLAWMLAGFAQREGFPVQTAEGKAQVRKDIKSNAKMRERIARTAAFQTLTGRQKKAVLSGRDWHPGKTLSWMCSDLFGKVWGPALYSFMSSHAHSDALSVVQIGQTGKNASRLASPPLAVIAMAVARMSEGYAAQWVASRKVYERHSYRQLNETYLRFRDFDPGNESAAAT